MAAEVKGTKKTATETLAEAGLQAALEEKVHDFEEQLETPLGQPTSEQVEDYTAKWGDLVIMNATSLTVTLPLADRDHIGRFVVVKNLDSGNLTVAPAGDDTINGSAADVTVATDKCYGYVCQAADKWIEIWR